MGGIHPGSNGTFEIHPFFVSELTSLVCVDLENQSAEPNHLRTKPDRFSPILSSFMTILFGDFRYHTTAL